MKLEFHRFHVNLSISLTNKQMSAAEFGRDVSGTLTRNETGKGSTFIMYDWGVNRNTAHIDLAVLVALLKGIKKQKDFKSIVFLNYYPEGTADAVMKLVNED